jgi:predicted permease
MWRRLWHRVSVLLRPGRFDRDLAEELDFHRAMLERDKGQGLDAESAATAARRQLGNTLAAREAAREAWPLVWLDALRADCRVTWRTLTRARGFAATAVLTFALGIGVNIAVLTALDRLMFRPLPFPEPDGLVQLHMYTVASASPYATLSGTIGHQVREKATSLRGDLAFAKAAETDRIVEGFGEAPIRIGMASANLLRVLNIRPAVGRDFTPDAERASAPREVLLAYETWRTRFGSSEAVIGQLIGSPTRGYRVVGVLPRDFLVPSSLLAEKTDALVVQENAFVHARPGAIAAAPIARLAPGATVAQAQAEVSAIVSQIPRDPALPASWPDPRVVVQPLQHGLFFLYANYLWLIVAASSLVWLLACTNLATLLLAHRRSREREAVMRAALGASPARLVVTALLEPLAICLAGSALAFAACWWAQSILIAVMPAAFRGFAIVGLDVRLIALTLTAAIISAFVAGLVPVASIRRIDVLAVLRRHDYGGAFRLVGGASLLAVEAAVGVVLVVGAVATVPTFARLIVRDPGFTASNLYALDLNHGADEDRAEMRYGHRRVRDVLDTVRAAPGVVAAGAVTQLPIGEGTSASSFWQTYGIEGNAWGVSANVFDALDTPIIQGRDFANDEIDQAGPVAIVNQSGARRLGSAADFPIVGRQVRWSDRFYTVVGVVADIQPVPGATVQPALFVPITSAFAPVVQTSLTVAVRMTPGSAPDGQLLGARLAPRFGMHAVRVQNVSDDLIEPWLHRPRFLATLFGSLAAISVVLAAIGIYAVSRCETSRRRYEIAVRTALGASRRQIRRLVLRRSLRPVAVGALVGTGAAWAGATYLEALVHGLDVRDPVTLAVAPLVMLIAATLAGWGPARQVATTDPTRVLRES